MPDVADLHLVKTYFPGTLLETSGLTIRTLVVSNSIIGVVAPGWRIHVPLELSVAEDEYGQFIASDAKGENLGYGSTLPEAIRDYINSLIKLVERLDEKEKTFREEAQKAREQRNRLGLRQNTVKL